MPTHRSSPRCANILGTQYVNEKRAQFVGSAGDECGSFLFGAFQELRGVVEHCCTRSRGADDRLATISFKLLVKQIDRSSAHSLSFAAVPGVQCGLPTASLALIKDNFTATPLEHFDGRKSGAGPELVYEAACIEPNLHRGQNSPSSEK